jgi:hypothetical protein
MTSTYPRPSSTYTLGIKTIRRAIDIPALPLPDNLELPPLPSPPRDPNFVAGYTLTTHLVPSAYPRYSFLEARPYRSTPDELIDDRPPDTAPKHIREEWASAKAKAIQDRREKVLEARKNDAPYDGLLKNGDNGPVLWNVLNRIARVDPPQDPRDFGITVIVCHANGLHKEVRRSWKCA